MKKKSEIPQLANLFIDNPTQKNFEAIKGNYLALSLLYQSNRFYPKDKLTIFFKDQKEEDWKKMYYGSFGELRDFAYKVIEKSDKTFEEWVSFHFQEQDQELATLALKKISTFDKSFNEWVEIFEKIEEGDICEETIEFKNIVIQKIYDVSESFEELLFVYENAEGELKGNAFVYMIDAI